MTRSGSAENKPEGMVCNTFGSTRAASTNQTAPSSKKLSTPCFAGTVTRLNATCILRMFQDLPSTLMRAHLEIGFSEEQMVHPGLDPSRASCSGFVEFFSKEGELLGDKRSLERHIHEITGIPV